MLNLILIATLLLAIVVVALIGIRFVIARERTLARWNDERTDSIASALESVSPRGWLSAQDLPLAMELMATLSEAGLGFDSALIRIFRTRLAGRPLAEELRVYQADLLAGRSRVESLRRLSLHLVHRFTLALCDFQSTSSCSIKEISSLEFGGTFALGEPSFAIAERRP